jgi:hypothetical protein
MAREADDERGAPSRRQFLKGAGAVATGAAGLALAGCGDDYHSVPSDPNAVKYVKEAAQALVKAYAEAAPGYEGLANTPAIDTPLHDLRAAVEDTAHKPSNGGLVSRHGMADVVTDLVDQTLRAHSEGKTDLVDALKCTIGEVVKSVGKGRDNQPIRGR